MNVRLFRPSVGEEELANIRAAFERSWIGLGPNVGEFETRWSEFIGCRSSIGLNSATAALHIALALFNFPEGKKVLVPALTFVSSATAALYNRLEPVFVDCNPETLGLDLDDLERKYCDDCVAIVPVHLAGHPVEMDRLMDFARAKGLKVVEDCAHTAGGAFKGRKLGTWGDIGCFSFEEKKCMTTGDGGMLCSDDEELVHPARAMRWIGIDKDTWKRNAAYTDAKLNARHWYYEVALLGYKYNMNDLAAGIGLAQLQKLPTFNEQRLSAIKRYLAGMSELRHIKPLLPYDLSGESTYHVFGARCEQRDELMIFLKERGIATGLHYMPLTLHPLFSPWVTDVPQAMHVYDRIMTLPLFSAISNDEVDYVVSALREFDANM